MTWRSELVTSPAVMSKGEGKNLGFALVFAAVHASILHRFIFPVDTRDSVWMYYLPIPSYELSNIRDYVRGLISE